MITAWFLFLLIVAIGAYDIAIAALIGRDATISAYVYAVSRQWPVLAFIVGLVIGHLLWPQGPWVDPSFQGHLHQRSTDIARQ